MVEDVFSPPLQSIINLKTMIFFLGGGGILVNLIRPQARFYNTT